MLLDALGRSESVWDAPGRSETLWRASGRSGTFWDVRNVSGRSEAQWDAFWNALGALGDALGRSDT